MTAPVNVNDSLYDAFQLALRNATFGNTSRYVGRTERVTSQETTSSESVTSSLLLNYTGSSVFTSSSENRVRDWTQFNDVTATSSFESVQSKTFTNNISAASVASTSGSSYASGVFQATSVGGGGVYTSGIAESAEFFQSTSYNWRSWWSSDFEAGSSVTTPLSAETLADISSGYFYVAGVVIGALALLFLLSAFGLVVCRRRLHAYHSLPSGSSSHYDYLYRPLHKAGHLSEECNHTFVGVSIPLLQEVTIV